VLFLSEEEGSMWVGRGTQSGCKWQSAFGTKSLFQPEKHKNEATQDLVAPYIRTHTNTQVDWQADVLSSYTQSNWLNAARVS